MRFLERFLVPSYEFCLTAISCPDEPEGCSSCSDTGGFSNVSSLSVDELPVNRPYFVGALSKIREIIGEDAVAIDLGCGSEMNDLRLLQSSGCSQCIGIDILERPASAPMKMGVAYIRGDIDESGLPLASESCDVVVMNNILEHLNDPMNTLAEGVRVLRRGGLLAIITPNQADLKNRMLLMAGESIYFPLSRWLLEGDDRIRKGSRTVFIGHVREYTASELLDIITLIGCELICMNYVATARTQLRHPSGEPTRIPNRMDRMTRRNRVLFGMYSVLEKAIPSLRAQISIVARRK